MFYTFVRFIRTFMSIDHKSGDADGAKSARESLLDAAEALFAENGFDGVSLRHLTQTAGTNLASVNYHFGSKQELFAEVVGRRIRPINTRRLAALHALLNRGGETTLRLEELLDAFARPFFECSRDARQGEALRRILVRLFMEADSVVVPVFESELLPVARQFGAAMARARPDLPPKRIIFGLLFFAGAMVNTLASRKRLQSLEAVLGGMPDDEEMLQGLVRYGTAGFDALAAPPVAVTGLAVQSQP